VIEVVKIDSAPFERRRSLKTEQLKSQAYKKLEKAGHREMIEVN
jgi:hypothetical protein